MHHKTLEHHHKKTVHMAGESSSSDPGDEGAPPLTTRRGGWITTPFIIATMAGLTLSAGGWLSNLIVFLIQEFNIKSIDAAQICNVVLGCVNFIPVVGAILADSFLGCFSVIWISSLISLLGQTLLVLTVTVDGLRPPQCATNPCTPSNPSHVQYTLLFAALALASIGNGGTRFTLGTIGANQFTKPSHQATYFNWYFFTMYFASLVSTTGIVYIQDNVSWALGYGIGIVANTVGLAVFLLGRRYYSQEERQGSPFTSIVRVVVASVRKRKEVISTETEDYYYGDDHKAEPPTTRFRSLNRAALKIERDSILPNGTVQKPWELCTVKQVEDFKTLIRIIPLWSTSILLSTPIGIQTSLSVLQALTTNRHLGHHHFQIPAGSIIVFTLISTSISLVLMEHCLWPLWKKVARKNPTPLQQIGIGHVLNIASMAVSALVEARRRRAATTSGGPISILWLVPQLALVGIGEAFHFPGQVELYYQEFPESLKTLATAMIALLIGVAFYLSTAVIDFVRRVTGWLPDDINNGRLDNVYWVLVGLGVVNFGYYLVCSWMYEYKNVEVVEEDQGVSDK